MADINLLRPNDIQDNRSINYVKYMNIASGFCFCYCSLHIWVFISKGPILKQSQVDSLRNTNNPNTKVKLLPDPSYTKFFSIIKLG